MSKQKKSKRVIKNAKSKAPKKPISARTHSNRNKGPRRAAAKPASRRVARVGKIPAFSQPVPPTGVINLGPSNGIGPRANIVLPSNLPAGTHLRDTARDTHVGRMILSHQFATKTGPNEFSTIDGYQVRDPILTPADVTNYRRTSRPLQQVRELVKGLYSQHPELMTRSSDLTLLEIIYQYADDSLAAFMQKHKPTLIELFAVVSASMVQSAVTQIRCHDGDIELLHADTWWIWCLRTMPRRYILDCMGLPRNTPGRIRIDVTQLTQAQLDRFIRCRLMAAWLRSAKTASALTERCNVMRRSGTNLIQQRLPLLDVAEFDANGVYQQPFTSAGRIAQHTVP